MILRTKIYLSMFLFFLFFSSCSTTKKSLDVDVSADLSSSLNQINDELLVEAAKSNSTAFIDKTSLYGLSAVKAYNINVVDINGDNYSDIVVIPSFYSQPEFYYYNIHKKIFEKGKSPFDSGVKSSFLLFYDLNHDNILDVVSGVLNQKTEMSKEPLRIYYGMKKEGELHFKDSKISLPATPNSTIGLVDYNLDGRLDLFVGNWFFRYKGSPLPNRDYLFENTKDGKFEDVSFKLLGETKQNIDKTMYPNATPTYASQICDMDQDGFPDILTTSTNKYKNKLWMNRFHSREGYRFYEDFGVESLYAGDTDGNLNNQGGGRSFAIACSDFNNDGIMDLFLGELSHNYDPDGTDKSSLLTGASLKFPPNFYRTEYSLDSFDPNWHQADRRGVWVDYNNDGLLDLIVDNSGYPPHTKLILFKQLPDHSFENKAQELGLDVINPIGTVIADFNRDGKMDILTSQSNIRDASIEPRLYLFENNMNLETKRSIRFYLRGLHSNFHGLNAMVILKIKTPQGLVYRRQNVSYSYGALPPQNEEGVHFGLNEGEEILNIVVRWPYASNLNKSRGEFEKKYEFKTKITDFLNITLCEDGELLIGRRNCHSQ